MRLRRVPIDTYRENVAYMRRDCPLCRSQGFRALSKVRVRAGEREIVAVLNVSDLPIIGQDEIGLCLYAFDRLGLPEGTEVEVSPPQPTYSVQHVKSKLAGRRLSQAQLDEIVADIVDDRYSKVELTSFVIACAQNRLDRDEIVALTRAMVRHGRTLDWRTPMVVDKHCIGGLPANRTTPIVVSIVAAFGLPIPKTSSRAITSPAGTADTMEVLADVRLSFEEMRDVVRREGGVIAWGGALDLSPADDIIIQVERPLGIDSEGQMVASILAKKKAAGATHVLLDVPVGPTAKVRDRAAAERLKGLFEYAGAALGLTVKVVFTDGLQPMGRGIGPLLEAEEVLRVLENAPDAPRDLREKSLFLAGQVIEFSPGVAAGEGEGIARSLLESGRALEKFNRIRRAQGWRDPPPRSPTFVDVPAERAGVVRAVDNERIAQVAKIAGSQAAPRAGVLLFRKLGEPVAAGEPLFRIYAEHEAELGFARRCVADLGNPVTVGD